MIRYFKEVREDGHTSCFSAENNKVAMHLTCAFGLNEGDVTPDQARQKEWSCDGITITEISYEEYYLEDFRRLCEFYSHVG